MLSLIPMYGMMFTTGGLSPEELVMSLSLLTEVLFITNLIGIYCSILLPRPVYAVSTAYVLVGCYFFLFPFLVQIIRGSAGLEILLSPLVIGIAYFMEGGTVPVDMATYPWVSKHYILFHFILVLFVILLLSWLCARGLRLQSSRFWNSPISMKRFSLLRKTSNRIQQSTVFQQGLLYPDWRNVIRVKELRLLFRRNPKRFIYVLSGLACLSLLFLFLTSHDQRNFINWDTMCEYWIWLMFWAILFSPLLILPYAADCFRGEKDRDTWMLLRSTTLKANEIVKGKFVAGLTLFHCRFWALFAFWGLVGLMVANSSAYRRHETEYALHVLFITILTCYYSSILFMTIGMYFSARMKRTITVYALSFLCALFILLGIPYFSILLEISHLPIGIEAVAPLGAFFSPFFLLLTHEAYGSPIRFNPGESMFILLLQMVWMSGLSWWLYQQTVNTIREEVRREAIKHKLARLFEDEGAMFER